MTGESSTGRDRWDAAAGDLTVIRQRLAAQVTSAGPDDTHAARVEAALTAYEAALGDGLCHDGAWECALDVLAQAGADDKGQAAGWSRPAV